MLVWPDDDTIQTRAALDGGTVQELLISEVRRLIGARAPYERPRRMGILPRDLSVDAMELTADGRRNRAVIGANWGSSATIPMPWRTREMAPISVLPSSLGAVSSAG